MKLRHEQGHGAQVGHLPKPDGYGEAAQIDHAFVVRFFDKPEIQEYCHDEDADQDTQCGEHEQRQFIDGHACGNGIRRAQQKFRRFAGCRFKKRGQYNGYFFSRVDLPHMYDAPVAADVFGNAVFFRAGQAVYKLVIKINLNIVMGNVEAKIILLSQVRR